MKTLKSLFLLAGGALFIWLINTAYSIYFNLYPIAGDSAFGVQVALALSAVFICSFLVFYLSIATSVPTFVIAILLGMASAPLLLPITSNVGMLTTIVGISATLILFSGGLEMPFARFRKIALPVILLSTAGLFFSALIFSGIIPAISPITATPISFGLALVLGAVLASTDPTVLIPMMKQLRFASPKIKDLIIAESAATDVTGALLTLLVVEVINHSSLGSATIGNTLPSIFSTNTAVDLFSHSLLGIVFGILGAGLLFVLAKMKSDTPREHDVDAAFFIFVPIVIYALATAFGGSGFLAAFIAGLLFQSTQYLHATERFFNHVIDGFIKPAVFILLGAIVPLSALIHYAPVGIAASIVFILIVRPLAVALSIWPTYFFKGQKFTLSEIIALAAIRETGAVPAVLIITLAAMPLIGSPLFIATGLWVIIMTVAVPPAVTPWLFEKLGLAKRSLALEGANIEEQDEPFVILASRGTTYKERLPIVAKWANDRHIHRVCLLLCLEDRYTPDGLELATQESEDVYKTITDEYRKDGQKISFFTVTTQGYLHDAIRSVPLKNHHAVTVFVGKKMLDFYLEEIQGLGIPLYFLD